MGTLEESGYDPAEMPIPVAPAAHYTVGGIVTDLDGRTELAGPVRGRRVRCTGVHGANRLASNSLLECLVFGRRAALAALDEPGPAGERCSARRRRPSPTSEPATPDDCAPALWRGLRARPRRRRPRATPLRRRIS